MAAAAAYGAYFSRNGFIPKFAQANTNALSVGESSTKTSSSSSSSSLLNMTHHNNNHNNNNKRTNNVLSSSIGTHSDLSDDDNDLDEESFGEINLGFIFL